MNTKIYDFAIEDGPDRDYLFNAVEHALDSNITMQPKFSCFNIEDDGYSVDKTEIKPQRITSIAHENPLGSKDGKARRFVIKGLIDGYELRLAGRQMADYYSFEAVYDTDSHTGTLSIIAEIFLDQPQ